MVSRPAAWPSTLLGDHTGSTLPGLAIGHGSEPEIMSLGRIPDSSAAISVNILNDDPTWRPSPSVTRLNLVVSKFGPPTRARTAPVPGSTDTRAAVKPRGSSGRTLLTASW